MPARRRPAERTPRPGGERRVLSSTCHPAADEVGRPARPDGPAPPRTLRIPMKTKILILALLAVVGLYFANRALNQGPSSRGSLETASGPDQPRAQFRVGFLPVT